MVAPKQVAKKFDNHQSRAVSLIRNAETVTFPVLVNIGVPIEILGITTCEMSGFCQIFDEDDDNRIDEHEGDQSDDENPPDESYVARRKHRYTGNVAQCQQVRGAISITDETWQLTFFFPRATMHSCTRAKYFNKRFFSIPASCLLPDTLCQKLHLPPDTALAPQRCAILKKNSGYELRVLLTSAAR